MKNQKNTESLPKPDSFLEKLEHATPAQVSQAIIAKIMQKINQSNKKDN